jgi:DNA-binding NtrC family response regulator
MSRVWILHSDPAKRAALARLAGVGADALVGSPTDDVFGAASGVGAIVLGLSDALEVELEFAHHTDTRLGSCSWILIGEQHSSETLRDLFDSLDACFLQQPLEAEALRRELRRALETREALDPISLRRRRDALSERFGRGFADLDMPELLRAMDPQLARVPLVVRGEPGSGRGLLARYVHTFGGDAAGGGMPFVQLACASARSSDDLLAPLAAAPRARAATLVLDDLHELDAGLRATLQGWIELGLPAGAAPAPRLRWVATLPDVNVSQAVGPGLAAALAGIEIRIPPLRERRAAIATLARDTVRAWCRRQRQPERALSADAVEALEAHAWPHNLRELETLLASALASRAANPLGAEHLRLAPLEEFGVAADTPKPSDLSASPEWTAPEVDADSELPEALYDDDLDAEISEDAFASEHRAAIGAAAPAVDGLPDASALAQPVEGSRSWPRLLSTIAGELHAPFASIRALYEMFPSNYDDPAFRSQFEELVGADLHRIDALVRRLEGLSFAGSDETEPVDVTELLDTLLVERRDEVAARRLLVLKELEQRQPIALANPLQLRSALDGLLTHMLSEVPDGAELYVASHHSAEGLGGKPSARVLLRYPRPAAPQDQAGALLTNDGVAGALADAAVKSMGGHFATSETATDVVIVIDLPAPL